MQPPGSARPRPVSPAPKRRPLEPVAATAHHSASSQPGGRHPTPLLVETPASHTTARYHTRGQGLRVTKSPGLRQQPPASHAVVLHRVQHELAAPNLFQLERSQPRFSSRRKSPACRSRSRGEPLTSPSWLGPGSRLRAAKGVELVDHRVSPAEEAQRCRHPPRRTSALQQVAERGIHPPSRIPSGSWGTSATAPRRPVAIYSSLSGCAVGKGVSPCSG